VEAEIDLPWDVFLRYVVAVGKVSLYHRGHEEVMDVALEGMVDEFVFGGRGLGVEYVGDFVREVVEWWLVVGCCC